MNEGPKSKGRPNSNRPLMHLNVELGRNLTIGDEDFEEILAGRISPEWRIRLLYMENSR